MEISIALTFKSGQLIYSFNRALAKWIKQGSKVELEHYRTHQFLNATSCLRDFVAHNSTNTYFSLNPIRHNPRSWLA